ncbi:MAG: DUF4760 domain-containing protein [Verrucomicrobiota bacterium]
MKYATKSLPKASYLVILQVAFIAVFISVASAVICAGILIYYSQVELELKEVLQPSVGIFAIAACVLSISYVGYELASISDALTFIGSALAAGTLEKTIVASTLEEKNNRALSYISRWSAGNLPKSRPTQILTAAFNRLEGKEEYVKKELEDDETRWAVVEVLSFLEEMALVVNRGFVDEGIIRGYYEGIVEDYLTVFLSWIERRRVDHRNPNLYLELTNLYRGWSNGLKK